MAPSQEVVLRLGDYQSNQRSDGFDANELVGYRACATNSDSSGIFVEYQDSQNDIIPFRPICCTYQRPPAQLYKVSSLATA